MISFDMCRHACAKFVIYLVTDAVHRARVLYPSACAAHPACCLGIGIMPIQVQSSHLFTELSDYHTCCKTPDYKYWMPTLVKEITVFRNGLIVTPSFATG